MVWEASWLSKQLHGLPHVNLNMRLAKNYFDMESQEYRTSLILIGIFPALVISLLILGYLLWRLAYEREEGKQIICPCKMQQYFRVVSLIALVAIILGLLFEFILHSKGMEASNFKASSDLLDITDHVRYVSKFDSHNFYINFYYPYKKFRSGIIGPMIKYEPPDDYYTYKVVEPYRIEYGKYMTHVMRVIAEIQNPPVPEKIYATERLGNLRSKELKRFMFLVCLWIVGIILTLASPHRFALTAFLGVLWCMMMLCVLLITVVGVADFCQDPVAISAEGTSMDEMRDVLQKNLRYVCTEFNSKLDDKKDELKKTIAFWDRTFIRHRRDIEHEYSEFFWSFVGNWNQYRDHRYQFCRKVTDYFQEMRSNQGLEKYLKQIIPTECSHIEIDDIDLQKEDFSSLCYDDFYIWWLLMQLLVVAIATVMFIALCLIHGTRIHSFQYYTYMLKQIKFLKPATPPASYSEMVAKLKNCGHPKCQRAKVCKCTKKYKPKPPKADAAHKKSMKAALNISEEEYATGQTCYPNSN